MYLCIPGAAGCRCPLDAQRIRRRAEHRGFHGQAVAGRLEFARFSMRRAALPVLFELLAVVEYHVAVVVGLRGGGTGDAKAGDEKAKAQRSNWSVHRTILPTHAVAPCRRL